MVRIGVKRNIRNGCITFRFNLDKGYIMKHLKLMIPVMFCAMLATTNVFAQDEKAAEIQVQPAESVEIQAESAETQGQNAESVQNEYVQPVQNGYVETAYEQPAQDVYANQNQAYVVQNNGVRYLIPQEIQFLRAFGRNPIGIQVSRLELK